MSVIVTWMCLFLCTNVISCVGNPGKIVILFQHTGGKVFFFFTSSEIKRNIKQCQEKKENMTSSRAQWAGSLVNYLVTCRLKKIIGKKDI